MELKSRKKEKREGRRKGRMERKIGGGKEARRDRICVTCVKGLMQGNKMRNLAVVLNSTELHGETYLTWRGT